MITCLFCIFSGSNESWVQTADVTTRLNQLERVSGSFVIHGRDTYGNYGDFTATNRIEISHNVVLPWDQAALSGLGWSSAVQFSSSTNYTGPNPPNGDIFWHNVRDISFRYNTIWGCDNPSVGYQRNLQILYGPQTPAIIRHDVSNNVWAGQYPFNSWGWLVEINGASNGLRSGMAAA